MSQSRLKANLAALIPQIGPDREVAERLRVDISSVCRWRNGRTIPHEDSLITLASLLGVSPGELRYSDLAPVAAEDDLPPEPGG